MFYTFEENNREHSARIKKLEYLLVISYRMTTFHDISRNEDYFRNGKNIYMALILIYGYVSNFKESWNITKYYVGADI